MFAVTVFFFFLAEHTHYTAHSYLVVITSLQSPCEEFSFFTSGQQKFTDEKYDRKSWFGLFSL